MGLVLLAGWFYWFQWRPISIRRECYKLSMEKAKNEWKRENPNRFEETLYYPDDYDSYYDKCLNRKGLK